MADGPLSPGLVSTTPDSGPAMERAGRVGRDPTQKLPKTLIIPLTSLPSGAHAKYAVPRYGSMPVRADAEANF